MLSFVIFVRFTDLLYVISRLIYSMSVNRRVYTIDLFLYYVLTCRLLSKLLCINDTFFLIYDLSRYGFIIVYIIFLTL